MKYRTIGKNGPTVSAIGLGCMGISEFYASTENTDRNAAKEFIQTAYKNGVTFFDTADMYALGQNEILLGQAVESFRDKIIIATKCGIERDEHKAIINNSSGYIKKACYESVQRLGNKTIDVYFLHRHDPAIPIEDVMHTMLELVQEKKIKYIGLSEVGPETIERAHTVAGDRLIAVQSEFSMINHATAHQVLPICKKLGIAFIAYCPLARGLLSGKLRNSQMFSESPVFDYRSTLPQFNKENLQSNLRFIEKIEQFAQTKQCTIAQLALAWLLAQGEHIIPIPGTTNVDYLKENIKAADIILSDDDLKKLEQIILENPIKGERYPHDEPFITWDRK